MTTGTMSLTPSEQAIADQMYGPDSNGAAALLIALARLTGTDPATVRDAYEQAVADVTDYHREAKNRPPRPARL